MTVVDRMVWLDGVRRAMSLALAALVMVAVPAGAQRYEPLADGWQFHLQGGLAFSTIVGLEPEDGNTTFGRQRSFNYSLRLSRVAIGPVSGFVEAASADRSYSVQDVGVPDRRVRSRWWDGTLGLNVAARCMKTVCASLDAGAVLGRHRGSVLSDQSTGNLLSVLEVQRYEQAAIVGVRLASERRGGIALVLRHHEGLSDLPADGSSGRNRSFTALLSIPISQ